MHPVDRQLLPGLLALERGFVSREELVEAFQVWLGNPSGSLGQILAGQGKLSAERVQLLSALVNQAPPPEHGERGGVPGDAATEAWRADSTSQPADGEATTSRRPAATRPGSAPLAATAGVAAPAFPPRYQHLRLHARGGLGEVFLAEDRELHRQVALKEIQQHYADDPDSRERFVAEAEITGNLEHPGIVPVYGLGVYPDGRPFYAMRFIQGHTLGSAIKQFHEQSAANYASLELRQLLRRLVDACNAVAFAHSRGIIHRDLKPENVMLGPFGETLVVDWGLAKHVGRSGGDAAADSYPSEAFEPVRAASDSATQTGEIVGTPAYMSPEQAAGLIHEVGPASDVYGLGAMLYVLLAGQTPFHGAGGEILAAVRAGGPVPPRKIRPGVPRALDAICLKAMAREADERYASALDLAAEIERWLADEPVRAYGEPWVDTAFRWMRRHRTAVSVGAALLLCLAVAFAVGYVVVRKERDIATAARGRAEQANQRAQENAAATRQVIEQFLIQVGDDRWSQIPGFEEVRLQMVSLAVDRYRQLVAQQPKDLSLRADAAMAFRRCANLYRMIGQLTPAQQLSSEAVASYQAIVQQHPELAYDRKWCEALCDQAALVNRVTGPKAAEERYRQAVGIGRTVRQREPNSTSARQIAARAEGELADVLCELGRYDEALALLRPAAATLERAVATTRASLVSCLVAAHSGVNLGHTLRESGQAAEAAAALTRAITQTQAYMAQHTGDTNLRYTLARGKFELALLHQASSAAGQQTANEFDQPIAMLEELVSEFPKTASFSRKLAEMLTDRGRWQLGSGQLEPAAEDAQRSIELLERFDRDAGAAVLYQPYLAAAYALAGEVELKRGDTLAAKARLEQARGHFERAREANPDSPRLAEDQRRAVALAGTIDG